MLQEVKDTFVQELYGRWAIKFGKIFVFYRPHFYIVLQLNEKNKNKLVSM